MLILMGFFPSSMYGLLGDTFVCFYHTPSLVCRLILDPNLLSMACFSEAGYVVVGLVIPKAGFTQLSRLCLGS